MKLEPMAVSLTVAVGVVEFVVAVGVNVTDSVSDPDEGIVPGAGLCANVTGTGALAFNRVALKAVPAIIGTSVAHVITVGSELSRSCRVARYNFRFSCLTRLARGACASIRVRAAARTCVS
jgi:hypothetical protein